MLVFAVSACTSTGSRPHQGTGDRPAVSGVGDAEVTREGIFDVSRTNDAPFRVRIDKVLRDSARTTLRLTVTNVSPTTQIGIDRFGDSSSDYSFVGFKLLDPVGGKLYYGFRDGNIGALGFGSRLKEISLQPGVGYEATVYFPPLPARVSSVTVLTPGTTGEITGVPVSAGTYSAPVATGESAEIKELNAPKSPGDSVELPVVEPPAGAWSLAADVSGTISAADRESTTSPTRRSVALRSDILFPFGKATLTAKAKTIIGEAAREIMSSADPADPITVVGHTDAIGADADNQVLSEKRARAVVAELRGDLGGAWRFTASGRGETQPLADETNPDGSDNPEGRARNRRVEFGYPLAAATPSGTAGPAVVDDDTAAATRDGSSDSRSDAAGPVSFRLTVHPFRRDGQYLVAAFDLANTSGTKLDTSWGYFRSATYPGPSFASFAVIDPASGTAYRTAYVTVDGVKSWIEGRPHSLTSADGQRSYFYVAAPPASVTSVTFDAGPFGKITGVPVH